MQRALFRHMCAVAVGAMFVSTSVTITSASSTNDNRRRGEAATQGAAGCSTTAADAVRRPPTAAASQSFLAFALALAFGAGAEEFDRSFFSLA